MKSLARMKILCYKCILFNACLGFSLIAFGQKQKGQQLIDNYLNQSDNYYEKYNNIKSLELSKKAYDLAKKNDLPQQIAKSSFYISTSLAALGLDDIALKYIVEGRENCKKDDYILQSKLDYVEAYIFTDLSLSDRAISNYNSIIKKLKNKNDPKAVTHLFVVYQDLGTAYATLEKKDSVHKYDRLATELAPHLPKAAYLETMTNFYYNQGGNYLDSGKRDSALVMFQKCESLDSKNLTTSFGLGYLGLGNYYKTENPEKALGYYLKVVEKTEKLNINPTELTIVYESIAELYGKIGNEVMQKEFETKYKTKLETEKNNKNKSIEKAISIILDKQKEEMLSSRYKIILLSVFCITVMSVFLYRMYRISKKKKKQFDVDLQETEETVKILKHQVNESFAEVIDLAKINSHHFWSRFQEVYPYFLEKMLAINPNLKTTELTYCAYIYLGFSTKEIAEYTFKSPKTIENNRYNLRKKLFLKTDVNLAVWIREYINV